MLRQMNLTHFRTAKSATRTDLLKAHNKVDGSKKTLSDVVGEAEKQTNTSQPTRLMNSLSTPPETQTSKSTGPVTDR